MLVNLAKVISPAKAQRVLLIEKHWKILDGQRFRFARLCSKLSIKLAIYYLVVFSLPESIPTEDMDISFFIFSSLLKFLTLKF